MESMPHWRIAFVAAMMTAVSAGPWRAMAAEPKRASAGANQAGVVATDSASELLEQMRAVRRELEALRRSDAQKTRQIEHLQRRVQELQSPRAVKLLPPDEAASELKDPPPTVPRRDTRVRQVSGQAPGQTPPDQKSALDKALEEAQPQESPLDRALRELTPQTQQSPLNQAVQGLPTPQGQGAIVSAPAGPGQLQLMQISFDALTSVGTSTEPEPSIQQLEGGDHDPHKRGFTLQGAELFLQGAVDPYFDAAAGISFFINPEGDTVVELEEANFTTRALPHGLQVKAGQYFTEFGRNNPTHPHAWHWIDQPIINSRVFGPDGMRGPGARISWLVPVKWFSELYGGVQNANGETMASYLASEGFFAERPIGGRPFVDRHVQSLEDLLYYLRWENSWTDCDEQRTWLLGLSGAFGPNATGPDGNTQIYGADLTMKWRPAKNERGWPFVIWQSEVTDRHYVADNFNNGVVALRGEEMQDWGFYSELLYGFKIRWAAGLRYEFVGGRGPSLDEDFNPISRNDDPFRDDRHRLSPLLTWYPTEFSRIRFQYNYDHAGHLDGKDAHSFWVSAEVLFGTHPAHKF